MLCKSCFKILSNTRKTWLNCTTNNATNGKMERWIKIAYILITVCYFQYGITKANKNSKRAEIESELYKNVLPYIKLVEHDAEKARSEIKLKKKQITKKRHSKAKLLKEVDQKVIPWLNELTKVTFAKNNKNRKEFSYQLKHFPHNIHGPSALKLNQVEQIGEKQDDVDKFINSEEDESTKAIKDNTVQVTTTASRDQLLKEEAGHTPNLTQSQLQPGDEELSNEYEGSINNKEDDKFTEKRNRDIASEVAKITNEIAEFEGEINHMSNDLIFANQNQSKTQNEFVSGSAEMINKETTGFTDIYRSSNTSLVDEKQNKSTKSNNTTGDTVNDLDITDMFDNKAEQTTISKGLFEPKASLFTKKNQENLLNSVTYNKNAKKLKKTSGSVKIIFGGNVGFDGIVQYKVEAGICTYNESFKKIKHFLEKVDHVVVSLDSPFKPYNKTDEDGDNNDVSNDHPANTLSYAGIDTVVLANDHILDYGPGAAMYTATTLTHTNTLYSGFTFSVSPNAKQEPVVFATNGVTIGLLSYCMNKDGCSAIRNKTKAGPAIFQESTVIEEVTALRESGIDVVALYLHWGEEDDLMSLIKVKDIIRKITKVKMDVIVGNHPNIKEHYYYRGTLVVLSLGTFLTPLHIQLYQTYPAASKHSKLIKRLWDKKSERWEMPSVNSKLLQIEVNRDGLIPFTAKYLPIQMNLNTNHCLQTDRVKNEWWISICTKRDNQCLGSIT